MLGAIVDVLAAVLATAAVMLVPGAALFGALRLGRIVPPLLRPAAAVAGTIAIASLALMATLSLRWSLHATEAMVAGATLALGIVALLRWSPSTGPRRSLREVAAPALAFGLPSALLVVLGIFDSPHVRSDTYWHVALSRKLETFDHLSSAKLAFEAGAAGNANYPLPTWHALVAMAADMPRVDLWSATWFLTLWMGPAAMLAFGAMAATMLGERRAALAGCWTFVTVVVLGYGPYFFATRFLSYAGQVAIYLLLPLALVAFVSATTAFGRERWAHIGVACGATVLIGALHGNYVMYPLLFAGGGTMLLLIAARERWRSALLATACLSVVGAITLAAQLPWITKDDNFLRGSGDPTGEPTAFIRHRDVFTGTEASHHVVLGSLAAQPMLVLGSIAIPVLLLVARRRPGPWLLAGGALGIFAFARTPQAIDLIDRLGTVTPATRFDRVYPAAVGVTAFALGVGWLLTRAWERGRILGATVTTALLAGIAVLSWWIDSLRDIRRIVVTPFVEARWVGGLDPDHLPRIAVVATAVAIVVAAVWIRVRTRDRTLETDVVELPAPRGRLSRFALATLVVVAAAVGLAPATIDRAGATWQPEAYRASLRHDADVTKLEIYAPDVRARLTSIKPGSVVLAAFDDTRKIDSLAPVYSIEESDLRDISAHPPEPGQPAADRLAKLVRQWKADYVAGSRGFGASNRSFRAMLDAAAADPAHYRPIISAKDFSLFRVVDAPTH
ncbi:MAG: hypothetical protein JWM98_3122 [Thermoleophilia bacterium]|nr:hypothetical protein [Thermoleophilia bacterium]